MKTTPRPADELLGEGDYYVAERAFPPARVSVDDVRDRLRRNLKLVRGIGPKTEEKLKAHGYEDLACLSGHRRFGEAARGVLAAIERRDCEFLARCGASELDLLGFYPVTDIALVDIETTGLYSTQPLFLVGVMRFVDDGNLLLRQYLARSYEEEAHVLVVVREELGRLPVITTYNGRRFDVPYMRDRMAFHGIEYGPCQLHLDLLRIVRRLYRQALPDCRLVTVAEHLVGHVRHGDIPGYMIPEVYHEFVRTRNPILIRPILEHNAMDLRALALILGSIIADRAQAGG